MSPYDRAVNRVQTGCTACGFDWGAKPGAVVAGLRRLSDEFDLCAFGLSRVRREWERFDPGPGDRRIVA